MASVLIAPDSFKGTLAATDVAAALATAWLLERPDDSVRVLPLADGGEGTIAAFASAVGGEVMPGPWLRLPDGRAVVELAACCGLPMLAELDPLGAHTTALGDVLAHVVDAGIEHVLIGLGGSGSTDAGIGALRALGARFLNRDGVELPPGGGSLVDLDRIDVSDLRPPPSIVELLTDVTNPLLGPRGAASVFAPQKGASAADVALLEQAMQRVQAVVGVPDLPGAGAAGGTAYGLAALWGGVISSGADRLLSIAGFDEALAEADLVITGEGRFDRQSLDGKLVGTVLDRARSAGTTTVVVAGQIDGGEGVSLSDLAGSPEAAMADPVRWLSAAAHLLANQ